LFLILIGLTNLMNLFRSRGFDFEHQYLHLLVTDFGYFMIRNRFLSVIVIVVNEQEETIL